MKLIVKDNLESQEEVEKVVSEAGDRVLIVSDTHEILDKEKPGQTKRIAKKILLLPSKDCLSSQNKKGLKALKGKLEACEYQALDFAAKLADKLQSDNPDERSSMEEIAELIESFQAKLEKSKLKRALFAPVKTGRRGEIVVEDGSLPAKKRTRRA